MIAFPVSARLPYDRHEHLTKANTEYAYQKFAIKCLNNIASYFCPDVVRDMFSPTHTARAYYLTFTLYHTIYTTLQRDMHVLFHRPNGSLRHCCHVQASTLNPRASTKDESKLTFFSDHARSQSLP